MKAPTAPEQLVAALVLLIVAAGALVYAAPNSRWLFLASGLVGAALASWLVQAIAMLRRQRRVAAAFERRRQTGGAGAPPVSREDLRKAFGLPPTGRPGVVEREEQGSD